MSLQKILERSVAALEYSNTLLLQTSLSSDSNKPDRTPSPDDTISDLRPNIVSRSVSERLQNRATQERWMEDLESLNRDLDDLCGPSSRPAAMDIKHRRTATNESEHSISRSLPSTGPVHRKPKRRSSVDLHGNDSGHLQLGSNESRLYSHPPRAMTQYVHADAVFGDGPEDSSPSHNHTIILPSTNGLRSSSHVSDFSSPSLSAWSPAPPSPSSQSSAYASLARHARC